MICIYRFIEFISIHSLCILADFENLLPEKFHFFGLPEVLQHIHEDNDQNPVMDQIKVIHLP